MRIPLLNYKLLKLTNFFNVYYETQILHGIKEMP